MKIIQLKNYTPSQMTGFIVITESRQIVVVDGGNTGDTEGFLARLRKAAQEFGCEYRIDLWLLTHPHDDHYGVFRRFSQLQRMGRGDLPAVAKFAYFPLPDCLGMAEHPSLGWQLPELNSELAVTNITLYKYNKGDRFVFGDLTIDILRVPNPNITVNTFNNSSAVIRFTEKRRTGDNKPNVSGSDGSDGGNVSGGNGGKDKICGSGDFVWLVLGDLGVEGGRELLSMYPEKLNADAVQMAHHGQNGVDRPVYEAIHPRFAFWTTPDWLWTNTLPGGEPGKGPWATLTVRSWMDEIGAYPIRAAANDLMLDTITETVTALD